MEKKILKLKIKSVPDAKNALPSERRYSASLVLGFSVIFLILSVLSDTVGGVIIHKIMQHDQLIEEQLNVSMDGNDSKSQHEQELQERISRDTKGFPIHYQINMPTLVCAGCFIMALGLTLSSIAGLFAWKRWFIDNHITFFFLFACFSILTSTISLVLNLVMVFYSSSIRSEEFCPPIGRSLAFFVLALSVIGIVWSSLASKIGFRGMKNCYPEEFGTSSVVNTIYSKNGNNVVPPDVIKQFGYVGADGKLVKYLEKNGLPVEESHSDERVEKFVREHYDKQDVHC